MLRYFRSQLPVPSFRHNRTYVLKINDPVSIRPATTQHIPDLIRLGSESGTGALWSDQQYRALLSTEKCSSNRLILIAQLSGENRPVAGFLIARSVAPEWELENLVVASEARKKGIGTSLMEEFLAHAKQSNSVSVFLEVRQSNEAARALYVKLGFVPTGSRKSYYSNPIEDAVLYRKDF